MSKGRCARWLAGWRVAIRIARRDARRYKWRSALIVVMVGLPVLLLSGGITLISTSDISLAESVPRVMGSAQARISVPGVVDLIQTPDGQNPTSRVRSAGAPKGAGSSGTPALAAVPPPTKAFWSPIRGWSGTATSASSRAP